MAHQKYSREQMEDMVLRFDRSSLGRKDFCAAEQINIHTFYYWLDKFKKEKAAKLPSFQAVTRPAFISTQVVQLHYKNQVLLELPADYPIERLTDLIRGLSC